MTINLFEGARRIVKIITALSLLVFIYFSPLVSKPYLYLRYDLLTNKDDYVKWLNVNNDLNGTPQFNEISKTYDQYILYLQNVIEIELPDGNIIMLPADTNKDYISCAIRNIYGTQDDQKKCVPPIGDAYFIESYISALKAMKESESIGDNEEIKNQLFVADMNKQYIFKEIDKKIARNESMDGDFCNTFEKSLRVKTKSGREVDIKLCSLFESDPLSMTSDYSPAEMEDLLGFSSNYIMLSDNEDKWIENKWRNMILEKFKDVTQVLVIWLIFLWSFSWITGWVVRGFLGVPTGKDQK